MSMLDLTTYTKDRPQIQKVAYSHDAMIDLVIMNPGIHQNAIAAAFGYSVPWVSRIFSSDAFQARLAARKEELVDPTIKATLEERFKALVLQSMDVLQEKLSNAPTDDLALGVLNTAAKALGYGARQAPLLQQTFLVHTPPKDATSEGWEARHRAVEVIDAQLEPSPT